MNRISNQFSSIEQVTERYLNRKNTDAPVEGQLSFEEILKQKQTTAEHTELRFSKHASLRLSDRNIELSGEQSRRLASGVQKASEKGIEESLVVVDSLAFIVNVPNRTVVTAMEQSESDSAVFTNIDGAVFM